MADWREITKTVPWLTEAAAYSKPSRMRAEACLLTGECLAPIILIKVGHGRPLLAQLFPGTGDRPGPAPPSSADALELFFHQDPANQSLQPFARLVFLQPDLRSVADRAQQLLK